MNYWKNTKEGFARRTGALLAVAMWMRDQIGAFNDAKNVIGTPKPIRPMLEAKAEYDKAIKGLGYDFALARILQVCESACDSFDKAGTAPHLEATRLEAIEQQYAISRVIDNLMQATMVLPAEKHIEYSIAVQKATDSILGNKYKPLPQSIERAYKEALLQNTAISFASFQAGYRAACIDFCTQSY